MMALKMRLRSEGPLGNLANSMCQEPFRSSENYISRMSKDAEFADAVFLQMAAASLGHDIILLHVHADTCANGMYLWLPGGPYGEGRSSGTMPIFLAFFEESKFPAGHYQAMEPLCNGPVLKDLLNQQLGVLDVARMLQLPDGSNIFGLPFNIYFMLVII